MSNNYFQFKQFRVVQNHAAMRVGTDGVLLGAWAEAEKATTILDIGTGTGVIALMLAQRSNAQIDAIDIEEGAIKDAGFNFNQSPWAERMTVVHCSIQEYVGQTAKLYDCIVSNPPFFSNSLKSKQMEKSLARHTDTLSFEELIDGVAKLLKHTGRFCVILPIEAKIEMITIASKFKLYPSRITQVKPNPLKPVKRVLIKFQFESLNLKEDELIIETETRHTYTSGFIQFVKAFYLNL
ncbi:MAG: tRNA1(Val) (adenine(37)-N6)-methyltransferase [Prolixibacteraceae bacterium]